MISGWVLFFLPFYTKSRWQLGLEKTENTIWQHVVLKLFPSCMCGQETASVLPKYSAYRIHPTCPDWSFVLFNYLTWHNHLLWSVQVIVGYKCIIIVFLCCLSNSFLFWWMTMLTYACLGPWTILILYVLYFSRLWNGTWISWVSILIAVEKKPDLDNHDKPLWYIVVSSFNF